MRTETEGEKKLSFSDIAHGFCLPDSLKVKSPSSTICYTTFEISYIIHRFESLAALLTPWTATYI